MTMKTTRLSSVAANTLVIAVTLLNVGKAEAFTVSQASRVQYPTLVGRAARPQRSGIAMAAGSSSQVREQESSMLTASTQRLNDPARAHTV